MSRTKVVSWLLYLANARPPSGKEKRERFYEMKARICEKLGTPDGVDIQHFDGKKCFSCDGTGFYGFYWGDGNTQGDYCWKCGGSGWFRSERWVTLKRWKVGKRVFHQPDGISYEKPDTEPTIESFVEHAYHGWWHDEAVMWLALFFDWNLLRMLLAEGSTYCKWPRWLGPMVQLKQFVGVSRRLFRSLRQRCDTCNKHTWSIFKNRCERCRKMRESLHVSDDVPF